MSKQVLSIEQMQHLQELGLDTSNASAYWYRIIQNKGNGNIKVISDWKLTFSLDIAYCTGHTLESIPSFTLQDILDLLPRSVDSELLLFIDKGKHKWRIGYTDIESNEIFEDFIDENFIDAAYEILCWCVENGYLKTDKED